MQLIERALADNEDNVQLAGRENDVLVKSGRTTIYTRLVEGRFPKWRNVFPRQEGMVNIELSAGPFYAAVRQAMIVTSDEHRGVDFTFGDGKIVLAGHGAELGESHVELPIAYDGAEDRHHARPAIPERLPQGARSRTEPHDGAPQRRQRRAVPDRGRLCLRVDAAGPRTIETYVAVRRVETRESSEREACRTPNATAGTGPAMVDHDRPPCHLPPLVMPRPVAQRARKLIGDVVSELMARRGFGRLQSAENYERPARGGRTAGGQVYPRRPTPPGHARGRRGELRVDSRDWFSEAEPVTIACRTVARPGHHQPPLPLGSDRIVYVHRSEFQPS